MFSQASFTKILKNSNLVKILIFSLSLAYSQVDYKTQIEPIFYNKCSGCHTSGGSSGGLDLTSYNTLMAGGNSGASIVAGDHQNSLLWKRIDDGSMPPSSNDVSLSNVELVKKWINEGALATPQTSQNQAPSDFVWLSVESDTINISSTNVSNTFSLSWSESTDPDGDQVSYIVQAKIGNQTFDEIYDTTSLSVDISYQEFLDNVFESELAQSELVLFKVLATDGTDTVTVSGNDRKVLVDRSDLLSITSKSTPSSFKLYSNYPNPFNPNTKIPFDLYESSNVSIGIYNMLGQKVKSYFWSELHPGHHSVLWNGTDYYGDSVPAGVYMYQLKANNIVESKKDDLAKMTKYDLLLFGALFWNIYQLVFKGSKTGQSQIVLAIAFFAHLFFDGIRWQIVPAYIMLLTFFFLQTKTNRFTTVFAGCGACHFSRFAAARTNYFFPRS